MDMPRIIQKLKENREESAYLDQGGRRKRKMRGKWGRPTPLAATHGGGNDNHLRLRVVVSKRGEGGRGREERGEEKWRKKRKGEGGGGGGAS